MGGPHATALPERTLAESEFDLVVLGEGELTCTDILKSFKAKVDLTRIAGTASRLDGKPIRNELRPLLPQLDDLPPPAFDLVDLERHVEFSGRMSSVWGKPERSLCLMLSRGCPYSCRFCGSELLWHRKLRYHSADYSIDLIRHVHRKYGIEYIMFLDDDFFCNKRRLTAFCERFASADLPEKYTGNARLE